MRIRTSEALTLEYILSGMKHRYLLCWNGQSEHDLFDCACCITYLDDKLLCDCGCTCHKRIDEMAATASISFWLRMLSAQNMLPPFFHSEDEKVAYLEANPHNNGCACEDCQFLGRVRARKASEGPSA